jgi:predicted Zn-dependent peptidase
MNNIFKSSIVSGVDFLVLNRPEFKSQRICVTVFVPLDIENVSRNAILPGLLSRSCSKFPDFTGFRKKLADLYNLSIDSSVSKIGDVQILSLTATFLSGKFTLFSEDVLISATEFLCELLFRPKLSGDAFYLDDFEHEKKELIENIESHYSDKRYYSKEKCISHMCKNEPYRVSEFGSKESAKLLSSRHPYLAWKKALQKAKVQILLIGDKECNKVMSVFKKEFLKINRSELFKYDNKIIKEVEAPREFSETQKIKQAKLVLGFRTGVTEEDSLVYAAFVMCEMFGGAGNSKLFLNVRERLGLCYYCVSSFNNKKGILLVESGVDRSNVEKTKLEILKQLDDIKKSKFTDQDLLQAKLGIINTLALTDDSPAALSGFFIRQFFEKDKKTPLEFAEEIKKITREDILEISNLVRLDTVFKLMPKQKEKVL